MNEKEPMTIVGYEKITKELDYLRTVARKEIASEIGAAVELGDLKENAEYHAAKEKQVHMEKRLALLEEYVSRAHVIDPSVLPHKRISFGSTIKLLDLSNEKELEYTIVGGVESDVEKNLISYQSPLAKVLLGKEEGREVLADLPTGIKEFEVLSVYFKPIKFD
jgi:transcription elongation factor GreA